MKISGNLPWAKIPTHLPFDMASWGTSPRARCILLGAFCIAGASGALDTGMTINELAWALREDDLGFVHEAIATGYLAITKNETVGIVEWEKPSSTAIAPLAKPTGMSSTDRQQRRRAKLAEARVTNPVTNVTPPVTPVTKIVTNPAHTTDTGRDREQEGKTHHPPRDLGVGGGSSLKEKAVKVKSVVVGFSSEEKDVVSVGAALVYPPNCTEVEKTAMAAALDSISPEVAQQVLDELAGTLLAGTVVVRSKAAWCRAVAAKAALGAFFPDRGVAVANRRNNPVVHLADKPPTRMTDDEFREWEEEMEKTIAMIGDCDLANSVRRGFETKRTQRAAGGNGEVGNG